MLLSRYFIEVSYNGESYSGSQRQTNAKTIESVLTSALCTILKNPDLGLTGSSRTDAGVHALWNVFHFDYLSSFDIDKTIRRLNGFLPHDIVVNQIRQVRSDAHCRFDALSRTYYYHIYQTKMPFLYRRALYCPYQIDFTLLKKVAQMILGYRHFTVFSKQNTQCQTDYCHIMRSEWVKKNNEWVYCIQANRFLRGMVRAIVATMLNIGRGKMSVEAFHQLVFNNKRASADFSAPPYGLYLMAVQYSEEIFL